MLTLLFTFILPKAWAYDFYQLTEVGLSAKTIQVKPTKNNSEATFNDLTITETKLSKDEGLKKFPNLSNPQTILIMGDTGCRIKESKKGSDYQDCNNPASWPFQKIVDQSIKENPDLIIHLGDYHYREKCSLGKPCQKMSPVIGYGWLPWELDFFKPMQKLLEKTPIVIARGNHEDCNRAYEGYKKLLANSPWDKDCLDYETAQLLTFSNFAIINFDSSAISENPFENDEKIWIKRFDELNEKITQLKIQNVWIITHKPFYGIIPFKTSFLPGNISLRAAFEKSPLKNKVSMIFSGHIHTSMVVKSKTANTQIVLGNSGTQLDTIKGDISQSIVSLFSYESAKLTSNGFGYAVLKKTDDHLWIISFKDAEGKETYQEKIYLK